MRAKWTAITLQIFLAFYSSLAEDADPHNLCALMGPVQKTLESLQGETINIPVSCVLASEEEVKRRLIEAIERDNPEERIKMEELILKSIGFLPNNFDLKKELIELYTAELGGFYDPFSRSYIMAKWLPRELSFDTTLHELTHVLQDQKYDLNKFLDIKVLSTDETLARLALLEGEASLVAIDGRFFRDGKPLTKDRRNIDDIVYFNDSDKYVPGRGSLRALMKFPYIYGPKYVHAISRNGGYKSVRSKFLFPPTSTKEVIYNEISSHNNLRKKINIFSAGDVVYQDTLGEYFISVLLRLYNDSINLAFEAAKGWVDDRIAVISEADGFYSVVWHSIWEDNKNAVEFYECIKKIDAFNCNRCTVSINDNSMHVLKKIAKTGN